ncbi:MAG: hypothetical protein COA79_11625 [Planctomycetota bacterium]|nr:MAG: hypothetical protein COA79_11625 [Planctomycetota bacterium]
MNKKPNILILFSDQHFSGAIGAYGNQEIKTPNIDSIASDGVLYKNAYCSFPICTPSRYSLLSGKHTFEHACWDNFSTLDPTTPTFPKILKQGGYHTKAIGKMHYVPTYLDVGFDEMILAEQAGEGRWDDDYHRYLKDNDLIDINDFLDQAGKTSSEYRNQFSSEYTQKGASTKSNLEEKHHSTTWIADQAINSIKQWSDEPNLLMASFIKPHHPEDPPAPWDTEYDPKTIKLLPGYLESSLDPENKYAGIDDSEEKKASENEDEVRHFLAKYYGTISHLDSHIGRIIKCLKENKQYDNTMIIYTADHGDYCGYHGMILKCNYMYEPVVKIPMIIKYPGEIKASVNEKFTTIIDLPITICSQAELQMPKNLSGLNLSTDFEDREYIFSEYGCHEPNKGSMTMVRDKRFKLITETSGFPNLFFDLENDPNEVNNLYASAIHQDKIIEMKKAIQNWRGEDWYKPTPCDLNAPQIKQANVPQDIESHRKEMKAYFKSKIEDFLQKN